MNNPEVKENQRPIVWEEHCGVRVNYVGYKGQSIHSLKCRLGIVRNNCNIYPEMWKCKEVECEYRKKCYFDVLYLPERKGTNSPGVADACLERAGSPGELFLCRLNKL